MQGRVTKINKKRSVFESTIYFSIVNYRCEFREMIQNQTLMYFVLLVIGKLNLSSKF